MAEPSAIWPNNFTGEDFYMATAKIQRTDSEDSIIKYNSDLSAKSIWGLEGMGKLFIPPPSWA